MFRNYFKVAIRNLWKRKVYTFINILGLATGMTVCLLIVMFIQSELSYDNFQQRADQIFRVVLDRRYPGRSTSYSIIPSSIGGAIKREYPEVQESTRMFDLVGNTFFFLRTGNKVFEEKKVLAADSNFFRVFTGNFIAGDPVNALMEPNSAVITESAAKRLYGSATNAFGKSFETERNPNVNNHFLITGVIKDWPDNSHFLFDILISASTFPFVKQVNYTGFSAYTYLLLNKNASPQLLEAKFPQIIEKYVSTQIEQNFGQSWKQFQKAGNGYHYYLQPLKKIHLISDLEAELRPNGSLQTVYTFAVIAVFILVIACINFINLSTARSVERAREVGMRKTFGSKRQSLIFQFLLESTLLSVTGMLIAIALIFSLLPLFNQVSGKTLSLTSFLDTSHILMLIGLTLLVGVLAGLYPAFLLSSFKPIMVLKGRFKSNKAGLVLRNGLVIFQFAISVILIICTIIVNQQMNYMLGEKLGFKKDHIIIINRADLLDKKTDAFKNELLKIPGVEVISGASSMPGVQNFFGTVFQQVGSKESVTGRGLVVDDQYQHALDLQMKEGRFFSKQFATDSLAVVLNEKAVQELGLKQPLGARLTNPDPQFNAPDGSPYIYTVVGVLKDFHFQSLHEQISPLIITNSARFDDVNGLMTVRIKGDNFKQAVTAIGNIWQKFVEQHPFHYDFLDKTLEAQYLHEQTTQRIFTVFSVLAIFIACLGLLGLAAYTTQQRTREISIRKVLGADTSNIVRMLTKDFLKLVGVAALVAFPLAWWAMHTWLQDFAYRVTLAWWVFALAAIIAALIALLTISFQAIKAALTNPVNSLRAE